MASTTAFPLILAYGPWTEHDVLLDGHSRQQVCEELGLEEAPVVRRYFDTEDTALEYADPYTERQTKSDRWRNLGLY